MAFQRDLLRSLRAGLPVAVLLGLAVGLAVAIGANLSNATPSRDRPFGWPGAANFEGGVATVRPELVLATTVPALLLGLRMTPRQGDDRQPLAILAAGGLLVLGALLASTLIGYLAAAQSPPPAYFAFWVAHSILALSLFALGFLSAVISTRHGAVASVAAWCLFAVLLDGFVRWQLFRSEGYDNLAGGHLPGWFYATQILSPVAAYRALLIVWQPGFRDWLEHAALDKATLPGWLNPMMLSTLLVLLWVAVPLAVALVLLRRRGSGSASPLLPLMPAPGTARRHAVPEPVEASGVHVLPHRADRPAPVGVERRPRLNAHHRAEMLRMSMRPPRPPRRP